MAGIAAAILGAGVLGAGASIFGGIAQSNAASKAIAAQQNMFNIAQQEQQPYIQAGQNALPTLQGLITPGPNENALLAQTPGFQFANQMAQQGVSNQGTVTGLGGNTLLAGANAGTQLALGQAWQPTVNSLLSLIQTGGSVAGNVGNQAVNTGTTVGNTLVGIGNAQAGAATSVGANLGNSLTSAALFSKLINGQNMYGNVNESTLPSLAGANNAGI
jgi:hypothetical protein